MYIYICRYVYVYVYIKTYIYIFTYIYIYKVLYTYTSIYRTLTRVPWPSRSVSSSCETLGPAPKCALLVLLDRAMASH